MKNNKMASLGYNIKVIIIVVYLVFYLIFLLPNEKIIGIIIIKYLIWCSY